MFLSFIVCLIAIILRSDGCINADIDSGRSYNNSPANCTVLDCFFQRHSVSSSDGGIIYYTSLHCFLSITNTMFYNCRVGKTNQGGAIYFWCTGGQSIISKVCAYMCNSQSGTCHFGFICSSKTLINKANLFSMSHCSHETSGFHPLLLIDGVQSLRSANISDNNANENSGFTSESPNTLSVMCCTFTNNKVSHTTCFRFYGGVGSLSFSLSNVIGNNSPGGVGVFFIGKNSFVVDSCVFFENSNTLFYAYSGTLSICNSFIVHSSSMTYGSVTTTNNNSFIKHPSFILEHFNSYYCHADNPVNPNPSPTPTIFPTATLADTPIITQSNFPSPEPTKSNEMTPEITPTNRETPIETMTPENTPAMSFSPTETIKFTPYTPDPSPDPSETFCPTLSATQTNEPSPVITLFPSASNDPTISLSATFDPTPSNISTISITATSDPTPCLSPELTQLPTPFNSPQQTLFPTIPQTHTQSNSPSPVPSPSSTNARTPIRTQNEDNSAQNNKTIFMVVISTSTILIVFGAFYCCNDSEKDRLEYQQSVQSYTESILNQEIHVESP